MALPSIPVSFLPEARRPSDGLTKFAKKSFTLICNVCGKLFKQKIDLERHARRHTGEKPFPCPVCPYRATLKCALQRHLMTHQVSGSS
ncbi:hypothetical protein HAZT_HAZT000650 [Hyalella azteca]|uniref:C2H2-type domain-containing protein n=1 Tax=Hyalella azteca TaxID=294128 RepID=A0A6A0HBR1_HYAAZ|nr:hypothetical protein HAZT_HAZT000650 [Hyalella azteca]